MDTVLFIGAVLACLLVVVVVGRKLLRTEHENRHKLRSPAALPELQRGTVLVLHGPEGCGKTSLGRRLMHLHGGGAVVTPQDLTAFGLARVFAGKHVPVLMVEVEKWTPSIVDVLKQLAAAPAISYDMRGRGPNTVNTPLLIACSREVPTLDMMNTPLRRFRFHRADYRPPADQASADHSCDTQKRGVR